MHYVDVFAPREHVFGVYGPSARTMASIASGGRSIMENRNIAEAATRRGSQPGKSRRVRIALTYNEN